MRAPSSLSPYARWARASSVSPDERSSSTSQNFSRPCEPPLTSSRPSGLNDAVLTPSRCAGITAIAAREATSHRRICPSRLPEARVAPSGLKSKPATPPSVEVI